MGKRGLRFSIDEARRRGLISAQTARVLRGEMGREASRGGQSSPPQAMLWQAVENRWPGRAVPEYANAVPGRKFRIDIAFPAERLAVEVDGFVYHAKFVGAFREHTRRQNQLALAGWRILRYVPGTIYSDLEAVLDEIAQALGERAD